MVAHLGNDPLTFNAQPLSAVETGAKATNTTAATPAAASTASDSSNRNKRRNSVIFGQGLCI
jgi:hypothetical protein